MPLNETLSARLKRTEDGLICAVVQEKDTRDVLMVAWMNDEALDLTLTTGRAHYWSRSRSELWRKGDTSGNVQQVHRVELDCDGDAVLLTVTQEGPACHTGTVRCFDAGGVLVDNTPDIAAEGRA